MMKTENFCAFILSNNRAGNVKTYNTLRKQGYTGKIYIVVDNLDKQLDEYKNKFKQEVVVFDKKYAETLCDPMNNFREYRTPLYARNVLWEIAKELGIKYFIELDDDYSCFEFKFDVNRQFKTSRILSLDDVFDILVHFLQKTNTHCIAMAQGGDYIGGKNGMLGSKIFLRRKVMNSFVCDVERPFKFQGTFNDDVNGYVRNGNLGMLLFTNNIVALEQGATQQNSGGITEAYKRFGTYVKLFHSVMLAPSCVKISLMGNVDFRIHHKIIFNNCVPKIVDNKYKK